MQAAQQQTARTFGTATLRGSTWVLETDPHVSMRLKRLFSRSGRGTPGRMRLSHSPEVAADLAWFTSRYPLEILPSPEALHEPARQHREMILRLEDYLGNGYEPRDFGLALPPRTYQARAAEVVLAQGHLLIADEVGLGKTATALAVVADERARPAVIVVPTHLQKQWRREALKFLPRARAHIIQRSKPYPLGDDLFGVPDILIITYHKLAGWASVLRKIAKTVVFDEVHALRTGPGTQRYAAAQEVAQRCAFRVGLSATPIYNYGGEIYNVLQVLKPGLLGTVTEFRDEWCASAGNNRYRIREPRAFGTWAREQFAMVRHTRAEVGRELPDVLKIVETVDSDTSALDAVEDRAVELAKILLERDETERGQRMRAAEELSNQLRQATGIAKAPYVADFVRMLVESGEQVVLCGWHRAVYDVWKAKLGDLGVVLYTGSETPAAKDRARQDFVDGEAKVFILSLRSGEGLNDLQKASSCIVFGELDWSPGVHEQCIGRLQRDGQANKVVAYFLVAEDGSDPTMVQVLGLKREQIEGIRDPAGAMVEKLETGGDRVKQLAASYLKKKGGNR